MLPSSNVRDEPYRATKLWNEVIRLFRIGMPVKRHWQQFRVVQDSFTGAEAADWLHYCLKNNSNFGPQVSREQTIRLLCKFLKNHVIEDMTGRWGSEDFNDGKQLYRFPVCLSPGQAIRQPLALLSSNVLSPRRQGIADAKNRFLLQSKLNKDKVILLEASILTSINFNQQSSENYPPHVTSIWQKVYMSRLTNVLRLKSIEEVLPGGILHTEWLFHNVTKDDLSTFTEHEMPYWVISAMQCLANWPNSEGSGLPNYPGFERDIFAAVCGYFQALSEPLLTFNLYELFITVFVRAENLDQIEGNSHKANHAVSLSPDSDYGDDAEVEMLRRKLVQAQIRHTNKAIRHRKSMRHGNIPANFLSCEGNGSNKTLPGSSQPRIWKLDDVASRQTWNERLSSFQKLDELTEESLSQNETKFENYASLPELRFSTVPRPAKKPMLAHAGMGDGDVRENNGPECVATTDLEEGKSLSVENLLLDMSYRMKNEMEDALMNDTDAKLSKIPPLNYSKTSLDDHEEPYGGLHFKEDESNASSPLYRTMKPIFVKNPAVTQNDRFQRSGAVKRCDTLRNRNSMQANLSKANIYMEISASQPNISVTTRPFHPTLSAFVERDEFSNGGRGSLKPTKEDLENELMFSPICKPPLRTDNSLEKNYWNDVPKSDIVSRREVPPLCVKQLKKFDSDLVQRRLPYVSQAMLPGRSVPPGQQYNLSRSHSTLSRRPQKEFVRDVHSGNPIAPRPNSFGQRFSWSNKSLLPSAKSCQNFTEFSHPRDDPPSPLTAAFDCARTKMSSPAVSSRVVESLQLCLLLLPPSSRSKLRLLLRLVVKMCENPHLVDLHDILSTRSFILQELSGCIIRQSKAVKMTTNRPVEKRLVNVFLEHTTILMDKPTSLERMVQDMMDKTQVDASMSMDDHKSVRHRAMFCKQVTVQEYEKERRPVLEESLKQLLDDIVQDENLSMKEKRRKLKQFQKSYPEIYRESYPSGEQTLDNRRTATRKRPMLSTALKRLRSLRS